MPEISIIVPVYQGAKYLPRCVDSILAQTYKDFELILIDDGSTDNSGEICDYYATVDPRVWVFHQTNKGLSAARNEGIRRSSGKWLMFCDDDDTVAPDWAELLHYYADLNPDRLVNCEFTEIDQKENKVLHHIKEYNDVVFLDEYAYGKNWDKAPFWFVWNRIFLSDIVKKNAILFDESLNAGGEDVIFVIDYLMAIDKKMLYVPRAGYNWIDNDGNSASRKINPNLYHKLQKTYQARKRIVPDSLKQELYNKEFYMIYHDVITNALLLGEKEYLRMVLRDKVFCEILRKCDLLTAPLKLKLALLSGNYYLLNKIMNK